ncbi:hypothetical protein [Streptomyces sp. NBC_00459]|uniref:hypothetical protein n=1 Tax=Streptomyces sp. NBC_00459 TaxID=2975749 RepID=UPI002E176998
MPETRTGVRPTALLTGGVRQCRDGIGHPAEGRERTDRPQYVHGQFVQRPVRIPRGDPFHCMKVVTLSVENFIEGLLRTVGDIADESLDRVLRIVPARNNVLLVD